MAFQSLYRRYRSQTFDEVLGQSHVTTALKNAVREGRVAQGYLFSGPRGTGKTSTARILAKVLNCEHPADGEPDTVCPNCVAVQEGRMTDWLQELDAASNNGVADMRSLLERVSMGTSGARKVYILDEVHMLSTGASNALLKTLEEPPDHVVFVLATTEPNKVLPTIRSRTQHFEFNLLPAPVLADHVRHVIDHAGLDLGDEAVEYVVRAGKGSARDTLSALDQVAAAGGVLDDSTPVDDLLDALASQDAGRALTAVDSTVRAGRDPSVLGHTVIDQLRHAFLAAMDAPVGGLSDAQQARASALASSIGRARLTRSLEAIGAALIEMRQAPDAHVPLEVALVRLTRPETASDLDALIARIERLEAGGAATPAPTPAPSRTTPAPSRTTPAPVPSPPATTPTEVAPSKPATPAPTPGGGAAAAGARLAAHTATADPPAQDAPDPQPTSRPALGGVRKQRGEQSAATTAPPAAPRPAPESPPLAEQTGRSGGPVTLADIERVWSDVLAGAKPRVRALFKVGSFAADGDSIRFVLPNDAHHAQCEAKKREEVMAALSAALGQRVHVELVTGDEVGDRGSSPSTGTSGADPDPGDLAAEETAIDLDELVDAPDASVGPVARLQEAFPGAELDDA